MTSLQFPVDLESRAEFRRSMTATGLPPRDMLFVCWRLFRELAYQAQAGGRAGVLTSEAAAVFNNEIQRDLPGFDVLALEGALLNPGAVHGTEGWMCPLFASLNRASFGRDTMQHKGQRVKHLNDALQRTAATVAGDLLLLPEEVMRHGDGRPMAPDEQRRVMLFIRACDAALDAPSRPPGGFTPGLCADALAVLEAMRAEDVDTVVRHIAKNRPHPFLLGMVTEKLLARDPSGTLFQQLMRKVP